MGEVATDHTPPDRTDANDEPNGPLARVLAFPVGRSGTQRRRRRDAPASQPVRTSLGPERRLTIVRAAVDGWARAAGRAGTDAAGEALKEAAHNVIAALVLAGADDLTLEGSASRPVVVAVFDGGDHAHRALSAAEGLRRTISGPTRPELRFDVRTGVHSASIMDLVVGGNDPMPFRAVGTLYALAERLQEAAEPGEVLLSAETLGHVMSLASVDLKGPVALNDHGEVREAYCLLGLRADHGA
jgi:class 3 adenylate cyclase